MARQSLSVSQAVTRRITRMKALIAIFCLLGAASILAARSAEDEINAGLAAEAAFDSAQALVHFQAAAQQQPDDPFILQKIARQYSDLSTDATEVERKKRYAELALENSLRAHELDPNNAVNSLSVAISYGKLGLYSSVSNKVKYARLSEEFTELAVQQDPAYAWAWHVLGRWNYEVAELGGTKRFFVNVLFGGLPQASTQRAVEFLQKAVDLEPDNTAHQIELGFALLADGQTEKARLAWQRGLELPPKEKHDPIAQARARAALAKLSATD